MAAISAGFTFFIPRSSFTWMPSRIDRRLSAMGPALVQRTASISALALAAAASCVKLLLQPVRGLRDADSRGRWPP